MTSPSSLRRRTVDKQAPPVPDMQIPFLELLDALAQSKHTDTRSKTMQALFAILQSSGQVRVCGVRGVRGVCGVCGVCVRTD